MFKSINIYCWSAEINYIRACRRARIDEKTFRQIALTHL